VRALVGEIRVHRLVAEVNDFQSLLLDYPSGSADFDRYLFLPVGVPLTDSWEPPAVYSENVRLPEPDIFAVSGTWRYAMTAETRERLGMTVEYMTEFLPLGPQRDDLLLLNVLHNVNCLDAERSDVDCIFKRYVFLEHRLSESALFQVPETDSVDTLLLERDDDDEPGLRSIVEHDGLTGISFELVWSSLTGPHVVL